jgi:two-component system sensor histidine kinase/response regulator
MRTRNLEKRVIRKDGEPRWALLSLSAVPDDRGRPVNLIAQVSEATEIRAYREKLEELVATRTREMRAAKDEAERASDAKSQFLAHMSHEIRNPLHVILLTSEVAKEDAALGAKQRSDIETIHRSGKHLASLINRVLDMSKIEAGHADVLERPFDLGATLDEVAQMFAAQSAANGVDLRVDPARGLQRSLVGDGGKVKQVLINLVGNAVKFTAEGSIRIGASSSVVVDSATLVEISVEDSGVGIAKKDLDRLFEPFEQLDAGAVAGGTGLGLSISSEYARLMGGALSVDSAPGLGSSFKLTFVAKVPRPESVRDLSARPNSVPSAPPRGTVLIVDDMEENRKLLADLLAENDFETRSAADGAAALAMQAEWTPDVVLMDLKMPGINGLETIRRLRAAGSHAAILAVTAGAFGDDERDALAAGADFFIRKPYEKQELLDGIARVLDARVPTS